MNILPALFASFFWCVGDLRIAPIAASSPIIHVLLATFWFKEKIANSQKIGIILTLSGIILLSI